MVQLSHLYMTTGKTIALTTETFVGKLMSLLFNVLSRFVINFLPSKHLLISWLQSPSAVIFEPKRINSLNLLMVENSWTWLAPIALSTNVQHYPILSSYRWKYCLPFPSISLLPGPSCSRQGEAGATCLNVEYLRQESALTLAVDWFYFFDLNIIFIFFYR